MESFEDCLNEIDGNGLGSIFIRFVAAWQEPGSITARNPEKNPLIEFGGLSEDDNLEFF